MQCSNQIGKKDDRQQQQHKKKDGQEYLVRAFLLWH